MVALLLVVLLGLPASAPTSAPDDACYLAFPTRQTTMRARHLCGLPSSATVEWHEITRPTDTARWVAVVTPEAP